MFNFTSIYRITMMRWLRVKAIVLLVCILFFASHLAYAQCTYPRIGQGCQSNHTAIIRGDTTLWTFGYNTDHQVNSGAAHVTTPMRTTTANDWAMVACGTTFTAAIKTNGSLWTWGSNNSYELGNNTTTANVTPTQIGTSLAWSTLACGPQSTVAIRTDGTLWAWGNNSDGQLGNGSTTNIQIPTRIGTASNWSTVACGAFHTLAIKTDGTLWGWGYNGDNELGDATNTGKTIPTKIGTATNWSKVACGAYFSLAIKTDGTLWGWGKGSQGELGDGAASNFDVPTQIGTATNWSQLACGNNHVRALKTDGTIWGWGISPDGQVSGATPVIYTPTQINTATNWVAVGAGMNHSFAINSNGEIIASGSNIYGQLGDTTTTATRPNGIGVALPWVPNVPAAGTFTKTVSLPTSGTSTVGVWAYAPGNCGNGMAARVTRTGTDGPNAIGGSVEVRMWLDATQDAKYVKRHYQITPATNAGAAKGSVMLFFSQKDFDDFNAGTAPLKLPTGPADAAGIARVKVEKFNGSSSDGSGIPGSYKNGATTFTPTVSWNSNANWWEISFTTTGFSGFFIKTQSATLPLQWLSAGGHTNAQNQAVINWKVEESGVASYELERSSDGAGFVKTAMLSSKGDGENSYSLTDAQPLAANTYYRIKQVSADGSFTYSSSIKISLKNDANALRVYPNPVKGVAFVESNIATEAILTGTDGRFLQRVQLKSGVNTLHLEGYLPGMYILRTGNGQSVQIVKK